MSTGFFTLASGTSTPRSFVCVVAGNSATSSPRVEQTSVAMIAGPPALVRIATRFPFGSGCCAKAVASVNISLNVPTRSTPHCSSRVSTATSVPASDPVCEKAARAPAAVRPDLTASIGFLRVVRRVAAANLAGLPNDSRYMRMTLTRGSSSQGSIRSLPEMSALFPMLTK